METSRIFGIDFYRATAILMVLLANTIYFFQLQIPAISALAPMIGYLGLEIFFVLSGFLLGRSFYPVFVDEHFGLPQLVGFIKRKLLRIVPLYFIIVLVNIGIAAAVDYPYFFAWKYFLFIQSFAKTIPPFFPESWGLPIIVFGMLVLVILLFGLSKVIRQQHKRIVFPMATFALIFVFLWTKWLFYTQHSAISITQWEAELKTVTVFRLDSLFIGVLFGWLFHTAYSWWDKSKWIFAVCGCIGILFLTFGVVYFELLIENHLAFWTVIYLPMTSLILSFFLPFLTQWQSVPAFFRNQVAFVSAISYSIYLSHFSVVLLSMEHFLFNDFSEDGNLAALALGYLALAITSGFLLYWLAEKRLHTLFYR